MNNQIFKQYDEVLINEINFDINLENIIGTDKVKRLPRKGDKATIVEIYTIDNHIDSFELECVNTEGLTIWCTTAKADKIEFTLLTRQLKYPDYKTFIDKIINLFSDIDSDISYQFNALQITEIKHTIVGMYISFGYSDQNSIKDKINPKFKNPIDGIKIIGNNFDGQAILFHKNGVIDFIEIYSYTGALPLTLSELEKLQMTRI